MKLPILILATMPVVAMAWRSVSLDVGVPVHADGEAAAVAVVSEDDGAPSRYAVTVGEWGDTP